MFTVGHYTADPAQASSLPASAPDARAAHRVTHEGRRYYHLPDGRCLPSVTTVLSVISHGPRFEMWLRRHGMASLDLSRAAADRGTRIHTAITQYLTEDTVDRGALTEDDVAAVERFADFAHLTQLRVLGAEQLVTGVELPYAGTYDLRLHSPRPIRTVEGRVLPPHTPILADLKTAKHLHPEFEAQVAAYAKATHTTHGLLLHVTPTGTEAHGVDLERGWRLFQAAYAIWAILHGAARCERNTTENISVCRNHSGIFREKSYTSRAMQDVARLQEDTSMNQSKRVSWAIGDVACPAVECPEVEFPIERDLYGRKRRRQERQEVIGTQRLRLVAITDQRAFSKLTNAEEDRWRWEFEAIEFPQLDRFYWYTDPFLKAPKVVKTREALGLPAGAGVTSGAKKPTRADAIGRECRGVIEEGERQLPRLTAVLPLAAQPPTPPPTASSGDPKKPNTAGANNGASSRVANIPMP